MWIEEDIKLQKLSGVLLSGQLFEERERSLPTVAIAGKPNPGEAPFHRSSYRNLRNSRLLTLFSFGERRLFSLFFVVTVNRITGLL